LHIVDRVAGQLCLASHRTSLPSRLLGEPVDHNRASAADRLVRFAAHLTLNLALIVIGYRLAYELRFDFATPAEQLEMYWLSLPLLVVFRVGAYANSGVFRAAWLNYGAYDLLRLAFAVTLSSIGFVAILSLPHLSPGVPRSVLLIEWASAIFLTGGIPLMARAVRESPLPFMTRRGHRTLPAVLESNGTAHPLSIVQLEALLGRPAVTLDLAPVAADLRNRVILLTGAAGSIGSELARQIAPFKPARLVLLDQAESDLYFVHLELSQAHPGLDLVPVICDITNQTRLAQVYAQHRPDYIVHAAAYKHVPLMEANVFEAVRNNVLGTLLVATTAVRYGASKVLLISTDKAIRPSSVMGATKRIAERIIFGLPNLHRTGTDFRAVRFGNVLSSKGSVIPMFQRQLAAGGPITVTHPQAQRHFMAMPEAAQLVLQAGSLPESGGAITMLKMGEPVRIVDLAKKLIQFAGRTPGKDVSIIFTRLRPGEKLTQEQTSPLETTVPTSSPNIRISQTLESAGPELVQGLSRLFAHLDSGDRDGLLRTLCELAPECVEPLAQHRLDSEIRPEPHSNRRDSGVWPTLLNTNQPAWRERRRAGNRWVPPADLHSGERREGQECRRKEARAGGRRRTDLGTLLPAGSTLQRLGGETAPATADRSSTACPEAVS
jgi:FlaA1/EpsC-like NDP-sugar epimerase